MDHRNSNFDARVDDVLREVKTKLLSRDPRQQKTAVAWLVNELNANSEIGQNLLVEKLMAAEIVTLLCETLMSLDEPLVTSTLKCLASFSLNDKFHKQNHVMYVIEAILRAGHFLIMGTSVERRRGTIETTNTIVETLRIIFDKTVALHIAPASICNVPQLLGFLGKILSDESKSYSTIFWTAYILGIVLEPTGKKSDEDEALIASVVEDSLKSLQRIVRGTSQIERKYTFRAIVMICDVCNSAISLCSTKRDDNVATKDSNGKNLADIVYGAMMEYVIPHFNKVNVDEKYGDFYAWFVECLNGFYVLKYPKLNDLSNHLAGHGFFKSLPRLTELPMPNLKNDAFLLLSRVLANLAEISLSAETWLGGSHQFQTFLFSALKSLPNEVKSWAASLERADERADALLILFYYNFLAVPCNTASYLQFLIAYVENFSSNRANERKPIPVLKALWFCICLAANSHEKAHTLGGYDSTVTRLYTELESADVEHCYTHHPAIVFHCLRSTALSDSLRGKVVCLWLSSGGDVQTLLNGNIELMIHCFLDLVQTGSPKTVEIVETAIENCIGDASDTTFIEKIGNIARELLPTTLGNRAILNDANVKAILRIACLGDANRVSEATIVRSLYLLMGFIIEKENEPPLVHLAIQLAWMLLDVSCRRDEIPGVTVFVKEPRILKVLSKICLSSKEPGISSMCGLCFCYLIRFQAIHSIECENGVEIGLEDLMKHLYSDDTNVGSLKLALTLLEYDIQKPVMAVPEFSGDTNYTNNQFNRVIKVLYMHFHQIITKRASSEKVSVSYRCLVSLLRRCSLIPDKKLFRYLCEQPWTYVLIRTTIHVEGVDDYFLTFVTQWLQFRFQIYENTGNGSHAHWQKYSNETMKRDNFGATLDLLVNVAGKPSTKAAEETTYVNFISSLMLFEDLMPEAVASELKQLHKRA